MDNNPPDNLIDGNNRLTNSIKGLITTYLSLQTAKKAISASDDLASTRSRIDYMNDGLQTTNELVDMVYVAAQNSRGSFSNMADVVARFGNNAKDAFNSSAEVVAFSELINKEMVNSGAGAVEASNAMLQLSQALGSGVLRGDELNSILEQAPSLINRIKTYIEKTTGQANVNIREIASEGKISAGIVKNAIFSASDEINQQFQNMPTTWSQTFTMFGNQALFTLEPVLNKLSQLANNQDFQTFLGGVLQFVAIIGNALLSIMTAVGSLFSFIYNNWAILSPLFVAVGVILTGYMAILLALKAVTIATSIANFVMANSQLAIVAGIVLIIAIIVMVCNAIASMTGIANSGFGMICGGVNIAIQFFKNLGLTVANIAIGIGKSIAAVASNIVTAFGNAISNVQGFWYKLMSTALTVIESICSALNNLPFIEFDYSGITSKAQDYANKSQEAYNSTKAYQDVGDAFSSGMSTYNTFSDGWASSAYKSGSAWGDSVSSSISSKLKSLTNLSNNAANSPSAKANAQNKLTNASNKAIANALKHTASNTGKTAKNTAKTADAVSTTAEDLKYLRDIASAEVVNRFTTASITVNQTNHNNVNSSLDLDGITEHLRTTLESQLLSCAEGVH